MRLRLTSKYLIIILCTISITPAYTQNIYYISSDGDDANSGTAPNHSWSSLQKLKSGDIYLFRRGDTFNRPIPKYVGYNKKTIEIGSYGTGEKPLFDFFIEISRESWIFVGKNIYKANLDNVGGKDWVSDKENIGFIKHNGKIYGNKFDQLQNLSKNWDFNSSDGYLYVYFENGSPTGKIQAAYNVTAINLCDNMKISDIRIVGVGGHGVNGSNIKNVSLNNIEISDIGGSYLMGYKNGLVRYGNGIQFFNGCQNCTVQECSIFQVYDAAFTMQGDSPEMVFSNVNFRNNTISNCGQSFEIWGRGGGLGFINCKFSNNQCFRAGFSWSANVRQDKGVGVHLLSYALEIKQCDILIHNNTFYDAKDGLYYYLDYGNTPKFVSMKNKISLNAETSLRSNPNKPGLLKFSTFVRITGQEQGSAFRVIK